VTHPGWLDPTHTGPERPRAALLTEKEVRRQLAVSKDTLAKIVREKRLTAVKVESLWRFRQSDVDRYLSERENTREGS
jgi:excisionase family DNA binding protein